MKISVEAHSRLTQTMSALGNDRLPFWNLWRELADFYLPKRYVWLQSDKERRVRNAKNPHILDGTGTTAARILAAGMMNGITSPSRPWFSLRVPGFYDDPSSRVQMWCDEVTRRMLLVMAETNFYNSMAILYLDLVVFGSAAALIYEDDESVFRCFNPALGEFYFAQDQRNMVDTFGREFTLTVGQMVRRWGEENVSERVKDAWKAGGARLQESHQICHLIEPNDDNQSKVNSRFAFRETYWEKGAPKDGRVLAQHGFYEKPGIFPRWELTGNDAYGTCPAMDALADVIQLQMETKTKAQGLGKMVSPPIVADVQLQHRPTALMPNGVTYVAGINNIGAKPLYTVNLPVAEMTADLLDIRQRIRETFHNPLFNMISQLDTVRSATEIAARQEEKLVLLGSVLERFENEALDPAINRIFSIMLRGGMLPEPPEEMQGMDLEIQYVSILSTAQRAAAAIPTERLVALVGNLAGAVPESLMMVNWEETIRGYGEAIGVPARNLRSREEFAAAKAAQDQQLAAQQGAVEGEVLVNSAKQLSETDVGGGANALQMLLGG